MLKEKEICPNCNQLRYMTRHHVKNSKGEKTGEIQRMCRDCHDEIEEEYRLYGISNVTLNIKVKKIKSNSNYIQKTPLLPFHATGKTNEQ